MLKKSFSLKDGRVNGECWGNEKTGKAVIFSHGFGVRRDSRGMFDELAELLKDNCLVVQFDYVAHSQGCIIAGLVSPSSLDKAVLIAGPISAPGPRMKEYFSQRKGTKINEKGMSKIERSDGTITLVPPQYWREVSKVSPAELYLKLAKKSKVYFIRALQDQMVAGEDYSSLRENKGVEYIELQGNHDFEGKDRKPFLDRVVQILKQE
jgi:hypothetical protein